MPILKDWYWFFFFSIFDYTKQISVAAYAIFADMKCEYL